MRLGKHLPFSVILLLSSHSALAAEWSDNSISYRYGTHFAEPFGPNDINKNIFSLTHVSAYQYGSNFFTGDLLLSDHKDPAAPNSDAGAKELYVLYRHTLDLGKTSRRNLAIGPIRGFGVTTGFDLNTKDDAGYNSRKRMLVAGPTVMLDVPGFLNASLLALWESNAPHNKFTHTQTERYNYDTHPMLNLAWGIPFAIGSLPLTFEGFANFIAAKGNNEFGDKTKPETNIDMRLMYDLSNLAGIGKNTLKLGFEYQYWKNKFGNDHHAAAGDGAFARTPMVRAEVHF